MLFDDGKGGGKKDPNSLLILRDISTQKSLRAFKPFQDNLKSELRSDGTLSDVCKTLGDTSKKNAPEQAKPDGKKTQGASTPDCKTSPAKKDEKKEAGKQAEPAKVLSPSEARRAAMLAKREAVEKENKRQGELYKKKMDAQKKDTDLRNQVIDIRNQIQWWEQQRGQGSHDDNMINSMIIDLNNRLNSIPGEFW